MRSRWGWLAVLVLVGLAAACGSGTGASPGEPAATTPAPSEATSTTAATTAATTGPATAASTTTTAALPTAAVSTTTTVAELPRRAGVQQLHFEVGPIDIQPGQNNIDYTSGIPQPAVDGWVVRMRPDLRLADGSVPPVDVIHLHHGVWLNTSRADATQPLPERLMAAGEEKTTTAFPAPYGYWYSATDRWVLNFMLHNLLPEPTQVWITYDLDFIPADSPDAAGIVPVHPVWMDVENGKNYPVFDVIRGDGGGDGQYTYPDEAVDPYAGRQVANEWTAPADGVLVATAGHLHPGGLHTDLWATRDGVRVPLFSSVADYFEPAGAVSWDVAMTATPPDWAVAVRAGDVLSVSATYDSADASWYESMGIMVVWMADASAGGPPGADPFTADVAVDGMLTHGHLPENDNHGGEPADGLYRDLTQAPSEAVTGTVPIVDWVYSQGDMSLATAVPTVAAGQTITFSNVDAPVGNGTWHTITACKAPCDLSTGIAYPLADADIPFDSGELGVAGPPTAGRIEWTTPADLPDGTYTYFCRIHPLIRGAFRIDGDAEITPS